MRDRSVSFDSLGFSKARFAKRASEAEKVPELVFGACTKKDSLWAGSSSTLAW